MRRLWDKVNTSKQMEPASLRSSAPVTANYSNGHIVVGGGVAIFHLATARVVIVYHPGDGYWFLPKGRRDIHESSEQGAEREGYEEAR